MKIIPDSYAAVKVVILQHGVPSPEFSGTIFAVSGCIKSQGMIFKCGKEKLLSTLAILKKTRITVSV